MPRWVWISTVLILATAASVTILYWNDLYPREGATAIVRNVGLVAGGLIAGVIAFWRGSLASEQIQVIQQEQYHSRFQQACELLFTKGQRNSHIRLAGIRAFGHLTRDAPELAEDIQEVLLSFIKALQKDENDLREFHDAQTTAQRACDYLEGYELQDSKEIDSMRSSIEGATREAAIRMEVKIFPAGVGSADRPGVGRYG